MITKKHFLYIPYTKYALCLALSLFIAGTSFSQKTAKSSHEKVFKEVDQMPQFPGCNETSTDAQELCSNKKFLTFIYENLKYPKADANKGVEGMVLLNFVVTAKGKIKNISTKHSLSEACDAEGIRVVQLMNEKGIVWVPGQKDGKAVDVSFTLPLKFKLQ